LSHFRKHRIGIYSAIKLAEVLAVGGEALFTLLLVLRKSRANKILLGLGFSRLLVGFKSL
jgi:hypothetical protein